MAVGIVVALEREARVVRRVLGRLPTDRCIALRVSGMGGPRAAAAARSLVRDGAHVLLSTGFAGGLDVQADAGDLLIPHKVYDDARGIVHACALAPALCRELSSILPLHAGMLVSVAGPVAGSDAKRALAKRLGAVAVDMESAAIGEVAHVAGIGFAVLRAVSDAADLSLPAAALEATGVRGRVDGLMLARAVLRHPGELRALLRLAAGSRRASRTLERALPAALDLLCAS